MSVVPHSYSAALQERIDYWRDHSLKNGWPSLGKCCDKCKMTSPRNPLQAACGCRDPFQINCECHIPVRKAFRDCMVLELEAVQKRLESNPHNGPSMPFEAVGLVNGNGEFTVYERPIPDGEHILYITRKGLPDATKDGKP